MNIITAPLLASRPGSGAVFVAPGEDHGHHDTHGSPRVRTSLAATHTSEDAAIRKLGVTPARYYQLLTRAAHTEEGIAANPITARIVRERVSRDGIHPWIHRPGIVS